MAKITFVGAGSTVFVKNVLSDTLVSPVLSNSEINLYDIDAKRLKESELLLTAICNNVGSSVKIKSYCGAEKRKAALDGVDYVINAIQVGGYNPCTITDFRIPKKYGLQQTIGDTLGVGGVFRALRTIPVMMGIARDMEDMCPDAWFLNYTNPMAILTGAMITMSPIKTIGLCHSVQVCCSTLLKEVGMEEAYDDQVQWKIAGINHQAWLLEINKCGQDLYPEIKRRAAAITEKHKDMVRFEIMKRLGYYLTESSEHNAEYMPFFIKNSYPELIDRFNIPLDEYPRRCIKQIADWNKQRDELTKDPNIGHIRTREYASYIIEAIETNIPYKIGGNVLNTGLITNLPQNAVVEVPCLVDASGISPTVVGALPEQCAALNRTNINVQLLTLQASRTLRKEDVYRAVMMDPHTQSELSIDDIVAMCDELFKAHEGWLPKFK